MLAKFQSDNQSLNMLQTSWAAELDPVLANPISQSRILTNQVLKAGMNTINHGLGRKLQGWIVIGINGVSTIYDSQSSNPMAQLTLLLSASSPVTISLLVF